MIDLTTAYWRQTISLFLSSLLFAIFSRDIVDYYSRLSSTFTWKPAQHFTAPFSVSLNGSHFECFDRDDLFHVENGTKRSNSIVLAPFLAVMLIGIFCDLFSDEMILVARKLFSILRLAYMKCCCNTEADRFVPLDNTESHLETDANERETPLSVGTKHAMVTTLARLLFSVPPLFLVSEAYYRSFIRITDVKGELLETDLSKKLVPIDLRGFILLSVFPHILPLGFTMFFLALVPFALIVMVARFMVTTSYDDYKKMITLIFNCLWRPFILNTINLVIVIVTCFSICYSGSLLMEDEHDPLRKKKPTEVLACVPNADLTSDWIACKVFLLFITSTVVCIPSIFKIRRGRYRRDQRNSANSQEIEAQAMELLPTSSLPKGPSGNLRMKISHSTVPHCFLTSEPPEASDGDIVVPLYLHIRNLKSSRGRTVVTAVEDRSAK